MATSQIPCPMCPTLQKSRFPDRDGAAQASAPFVWPKCFHEPTAPWTASSPSISSMLNYQGPSEMRRYKANAGDLTVRGAYREPFSWRFGKDFEHGGVRPEQAMAKAESPKKNKHPAWATGIFFSIGRPLSFLPIRPLRAISGKPLPSPPFAGAPR